MWYFINPQKIPLEWVVNFKFIPPNIFIQKKAPKSFKKPKILNFIDK
jgi:hypothetical protein